MNNIFKIKSNSRKIITIITDIATVFASAQTKEADEAINYTLQIIAEFVNADRSYIFRYDFENDTTDNTHEYCAKSISKEIDNLQGVPLSMVPDWVDTHKKRQAMNIYDVSKLSINSGVRMILEPQGIKSLLTIPLYHNAVLRGFLGFDSVKKKHKYTEFESMVLNEYSKLLLNFLIRIEQDLELQKEKDMVDLLVKAASIGTWDWDIENDRVTVNDICANMLGYKESDFPNSGMETWKRIMPPENIESEIKALNDVLNKKETNYSRESRLRKKNGEIIWVKSSGKVTEWINGTAKRFSAASIDITNIKENEIELNVITKAIDFSPNSIMITDTNRKIIYVSPAFTKLTGYSYEEVLGKTASSIRLNLKNEIHFDELKKTIYNKGTWSGEFYNRRKDGSYYWENISLAAVFDKNNNVTHHISISQEITDRKLSTLALNQKRQEIEDDNIMKVKEIETSQQSAIVAMARLTEAKDENTGKHIERVQHLCKALASKLNENIKFKKIINEKFINDIFYASALHDIGKVNIPDSILLKPGKLTEEEFEIMKTHVTLGDSILCDIVKYYPKSNLIVMGREIARFHHEKWDGSGYPENLKENAIPLSARIMALVDVYDAVRSKRPYKNVFTHLEACDLIQKASGSHFDPNIVETFFKIDQQFDAIYNSLSK